MEQGIPKLFEGSQQQLDRKSGFAKAVIVKNKVFMTTCSKLKLTTKRKEQECRLASGYFLVNKAGLFQKQHSTHLEDFGVKVKN